LLLPLLLTVPTAPANTVGGAREGYEEAVGAIRQGRWDRFEQLRPGLDDYPLAIYLDYYKLSSRPRQVRPADARRFIDLSEDTPLPNRFLAAYLEQAGRDRRWRDFLAVMPVEPNAITLKCYYFRARLADGDQLAAWEGAERLWVHGQSRPDECDPLFDAWFKACRLSDAVVWARLLKAFDERERQLLNYVARKGSPQLQPWSDRLLQVYARPDRMNRIDLPAGEARAADIVAHGLRYLARYHPDKALEYWGDYQGRFTFTAEQRHAIEYTIALRCLFARDAAFVPWLEQALVRLQDDTLVGLRLRWALREGDWDALDRILPLLSDAAAEDDAWRYWRAVLHDRQGDSQRADREFAALAQERDFYGFLAADRLGEPYRFNNRPLVLQSVQTEPLLELPAVRRIEELHYHEEQNEAMSEWHKLLEDSEPVQRESLAWVASSRGWHRMSIEAANKAGAMDRLELRFPLPYQEAFQHYASLQRVSPTELMAIARRESAFFPTARSSVGARGLMQVMPATGRQVARQLGRPFSNADLYQVDHNILLGSAYYRQLLDRYGGNRVLALAAYNAGPHRVDRWRSGAAASLPVEAWIETIPFRETRAYVKAVLAYNVVFQHLLGMDISMLSLAERQAGY
jgi:soluble lytic murein transglycosylase